MVAKKLMIAAVITSLLAGCGGNNSYQAPLPDGTYDNSILPAEDDYAEPSYGDDYGSGDGGTTEPGDDTSVPGDDTAVTTEYSLSGKVTDANGKAIEGATVQINGQSTLTDANGKYSLSQIGDTKVFPKVTKSGYDAIQNVTIEFTKEAPTQVKDFKLAKTNSDDDTSTVAGLSHEMTFSSKNFKTVSAMAVANDIVYVLGRLDGLIFDSTAIVAYDASTGEELKTFKKIGWIRSLPKDVTYLKIDGDQLVVSNGQDGYIFSLEGEFVSKGAGARYSTIKEVKDEDNNVRYKLTSSSKVEIRYGSKTTEYKLDNVSSAKEIGLDSDGRLLVLDSSQNTVHQFSFEP